jgi:hypothetical protein
MKFPEKVHGNTTRQGWLPLGGIVMLALSWRASRRRHNRRPRQRPQGARA